MVVYLWCVFFFDVWGRSWRWGEVLLGERDARDTGICFCSLGMDICSRLCWFRRVYFFGNVMLSMSSFMDIGLRVVTKKSCVV